MAKKCKVCGERFTPQFSSFQKACNKIECLVAYGKKERVRIQKAENREAKRDRPYWIKRCQTEFNKYIRNRDSKDPCISCNRHHAGQYHAGHYMSVGGHSAELRFNELNCHKQCSVCNNHKSGNLTNYRTNFIKKIGLDAVLVLERPHKPKRYTIDELKSLLALYQGKNKEWAMSQS
jgi:hypothetical protein